MSQTGSERTGSARHVAIVLASSTGGVGRHVTSLASGLIAAGMSVSVHAPEATGRQFSFTGLGADFRPLEIPASPQPADLRVVRVLRRDLDTVGAESAAADIVHAHGLRAGLVAGWANDERLPFVVTWHNAVLARGLRGRAYQLLERRVARMADVTLGASVDLVERARELGARDARLGAVAAPTLPGPVRTPQEVRDEIGVEDGAPLILSVGRLHPQKGYETLIAASARWVRRTPTPTVAIAGTGPAYLNLAAQISDLGAPVVLLGHRPDVADLLSAADLAVVSSVWEARQLFAQEALRAGTPLVSTAVGGLPELLGDGAVLVPPGDVDALDAAVVALLDDDLARAALGKAGAAQALTWPTDADTLHQVMGVYDELLAAPEAVAGGGPS
jgi:glycosyltransferase involved in cell wall biosynthesis